MDKLIFNLCTSKRLVFVALSSKRWAIKCQRRDRQINRIIWLIEKMQSLDKIFMKSLLDIYNVVFDQNA